MSIHDTIFLCGSMRGSNTNGNGNLLANLSGVHLRHERHWMLRRIVVN
jgi:hypothetical protein